MTTTLDRLPVGETGRVVAVDSLGGDSIERLMEMGLVNGTPVRVERTSPFGCPIEIRLKGTSIAIRRSDAKNILLSAEPRNP